MPTPEIIRKTYRPSMTVGKVYARPYGSNAPLAEIGNVLELNMDHAETVIKQPDMTQLGGGNHAEVRRVTDVTIAMKLADLNLVNLVRATLGTAQGIEAGDVKDEAHEAQPGGLIRLAHVAPTDVVIKIGADATSATALAATSYQVRPEGIWIPYDAQGVTAGTKLWISYKHGEQAVIEALTTKVQELELSFGGLNEADDGRPCVVDVWRVSQGVTKQLALINDKLGVLDVSGSVMQDPNRTGDGVSRYYRVSMA